MAAKIYGYNNEKGLSARAVRKTIAGGAILLDTIKIIKQMNKQVPWHLAQERYTFLRHSLPDIEGILDVMVVAAHTQTQGWNQAVKIRILSKINVLCGLIERRERREDVLEAAQFLCNRLGQVLDVIGDGE